MEKDSSTVHGKTKHYLRREDIANMKNSTLLYVDTINKNICKYKLIESKVTNYKKKFSDMFKFTDQRFMLCQTYRSMSHSVPINLSRLCNSPLLRTNIWCSQSVCSVIS